MTTIHGKPISKMTLGTVQLGLPYGIANQAGQPTLEQSFDLLDRAIAGGVTVLDTAARYGESEATIGAYLRERPTAKEKLAIVTKFHVDKKQYSYDELEATIRTSVESSLEKLGLNTIDMLLIHDARDFQIDPDGIEKILVGLIQEGLTKSIGASAYRFDEIAPILERDPFEAFQLPVNLLDQRYKTAGKTYEQIQNKTIFARSIYLQGLFFKKPEDITGNLTVLRPYVQKVQDLAQSLNLTVAQLCMKYVESLSWVDSLVIGAELPEQVDDNLKILSLPSLPAETIQEIESSFTDVPEIAFDPSKWNFKAEM